MEGSRANFGKELGQIHEGIITLRNLGLSADGWQKMADDKELAQKVVELIEGQKQLWLEKIVARERACHLAFFGQEFDLTDFANTLKKYGESKIKFWQKLMLEPHFLPEVKMSQDATNFRGWKVKPEPWFWQKIAEGQILRSVANQLAPIKEVRLEGITALIDTRLKPAYKNGNQMYDNDNLLGPIIEDLRRAGKIGHYDYGPQNSRFGVSAEEWEGQIKPSLANKPELGLGWRLELALEANIIPQMYPYMPRKDDGKTNTWVWYEEYFVDRFFRLYGGYSDRGGLADVDYFASGYDWDFGSVRPLAVL